MKKIAAFMVFLAVLTTVSIGYAHPPSDIKIGFNPKTKILEAVIVHNVSNSVKHYIGKVDVALNTKEILEHTISIQDNNQTQTVNYLIPDAKDGDAISVEGYCSISGKLKKEITVKSK